MNLTGHRTKLGDIDPQEETPPHSQRSPTGPAGALALREHLLPGFVEPPPGRGGPPGVDDGAQLGEVLRSLGEALLDNKMRLKRCWSTDPKRI